MEIIDILLLLIGLFAVLALMLGFSWAFKKYGSDVIGLGTSKGKNLKIVETLMLDPRRKLYLLKVGHKYHSILTGPNGDVVVDNDAKPDLDLDSPATPPHDKNHA